jgi:hypothetical protein
VNCVAKWDLGLHSTQVINPDKISQYFLNANTRQRTPSYRAPKETNKPKKTSRKIYPNSSVKLTSFVRCTLGITAKGSCTVMGADTPLSARYAASAITHIIKSLESGDGNGYEPSKKGAYSEVNVNNYRITLVVFSGNFGYRVNLDKLQALYPNRTDVLLPKDWYTKNNKEPVQQIKYEPANHPLIFIIFGSGSFICLSREPSINAQVDNPDFLSKTIANHVNDVKKKEVARARVVINKDEN